MLHNIKNKNITLPLTMKMDAETDTYGTVLAWSGWVGVFPVHSKNSTLKENILKFNLMTQVGETALSE